MDSQQIGSWAFLLGVLIALVAGVFGGILVVYEGYILLLLVFLGLVVGFLNITDREIDKFLIAAIALILVGSANLTAANTVVMGLGTVLQSIVVNLARFVAPAALLVSVKAIYNLAKAP